MKIHGVGDGRTVELYTASYTGKLLYNARNLPIQQTLIVPRTCMAIQLYSARVYSRAIQYTAYTLYSPIRRPSGCRPPRVSGGSSIFTVPGIARALGALVSGSVFQREGVFFTTHVRRAVRLQYRRRNDR